MRFAILVPSVITALGCILASLPASALSFYESINLYSTRVEGASFGRGAGAGAGIIMPNGSTSSFDINFTLPPEYQPGTPVLIGVIWHTNSTNTPCNIALRPNVLSVARIGSAHIEGPHVAAGLEPKDGNAFMEASTTDVTHTRLYEINPPDGVTPLQPLDAVTMSLFRSLDGDCNGDLTIQGVAVAGP